MFLKVKLCIKNKHVDNKNASGETYFRPIKHKIMTRMDRSI